MVCACWLWNTLLLCTLHRMHEMQAIVTDVRGVCLSVCYVGRIAYDVLAYVLFDFAVVFSRLQSKVAYDNMIIFG